MHQHIFQAITGLLIFSGHKGSLCEGGSPQPNPAGTVTALLPFCRTGALSVDTLLMNVVFMPGVIANYLYVLYLYIFINIAH